MAGVGFEPTFVQTQRLCFHHYHGEKTKQSQLANTRDLLQYTDGCPKERIVIIFLLWNHISEKQQKAHVIEVREEALNHSFSEYVFF